MKLSDFGIPVMAPGAPDFKSLSGFRAKNLKNEWARPADSKIPEPPAAPG